MENGDLGTGYPVSGGTSPGAAGPPTDELPPGGIDLRGYLMRIEDQLIEQALIRARGVIAHAALALRMRRTTLAEKLRRRRQRGA